MSNKAYLGDAVYGEWLDHGDLVLTTENGLQSTNRIVLEPVVLMALEGFLTARKKLIAAKRKECTDEEC